MLNIWQIYFDERSRNNCYQEYKLYDNSKKLDENFENSVIAELISKHEHRKGDYFGVFSHDIRQDIVFKEGEYTFNPENLEKVVSNNTGVEVFSFQKRREQKNIVLQAENYHPGIVEMTKKVLVECEFLYDLPKRLNNIILWNYFLAKSDIYEAYVTELLLPAMQVLKNMPEAYQDAKYKTLDDETRQRFIRAFGHPHYPYHPFLLERLPSVFMQKYNFSFKQIF